MWKEELNQLRKLYRIKEVRIPANGGHFGNEQADELASGDLLRVSPMWK